MQTPCRAASRPDLAAGARDDNGTARAARDQLLLAGQGRPLNSGWSPGVGSVNRQPKNGDATALGSRTSSPAGRRPVLIQDTRAEKPADSSLVVYPQWVTSRMARSTNSLPSPCATIISS